MKGLGIILIAIGIALLMFVSYNFIKENIMASPIPEDKGVKVIFVTPSIIIRIYEFINVANYANIRIIRIIRILYLWYSYYILRGCFKIKFKYFITSTQK